MFRAAFLALIALAFLTSLRAQDAKPEPKSTLSPPLQVALKAAERGDFETALKLLKAEAEKGSGEAANAIGELKMGGKAGQSTPGEALTWFQRAADHGYAAAHANIARLLAVGAPGVAKDEERAKFHMQQAAEGGFAPAQVQLGRMLESGLDLLGREPNWKEPRGWFEKAAEQGNPDAQLALVRYLDEGLGGSRDAVRGSELCFSAARAGSVLAMNEMGVRYQKGLGLRQDNVAAVGWFTLASQHGLPAAMVNLGNCYERANGLLQDFNKAGEYYAAAAKLNHPVGQFLLGQMFENGRGTEANLIYAYVNYHRAVAGGVKDAEAKRDAVRKRLTPAQVTAAEKLIAGNAEGGAEQKK